MIIELTGPPALCDSTAKSDLDGVIHAARLVHDSKRAAKRRIADQTASRHMRRLLHESD
jgi:hypothetical protein